MAGWDLAARLSRKNANVERLVDDVIARPSRLATVLEGMRAETARVRFGAAKVLRLLAEKSPRTVLPAFSTIAKQLDDENQILRWNALHALSHLAREDHRGRIGRILDRYLAPIRGPQLVGAANSIAGAGRIAAAQPRLADRVARALLRVEKTRYATAECRNVALGETIDAFDRFLPHVSSKAPVLALARRQLRNRRPSTRRCAERFVRRWDAEPQTGTARARNGSRAGRGSRTRRA